MEEMRNKLNAFTVVNNAKKFKKRKKMKIFEDIQNIDSNRKKRD